jgi:signal transduction histidine kinase
VVEKVPINLYWEVLQPVGRELAGACQRGEMTLELDGTLEALEVEADPSLMRVVFYNLIHNGVKYGFANGRIRVFAEQAAGEWAVHVRNDGLGIPAEEIPNLFQRFYRVRMEGRQQREGSGLGLFISREIVERHGGQLEVRSEHGSWADFIVHIPA